MKINSSTGIYMTALRSSNKLATWSSRKQYHLVKERCVWSIFIVKFYHSSKTFERFLWTGFHIVWSRDFVTIMFENVKYPIIHIEPLACTVSMKWDIIFDRYVTKLKRAPEIKVVWYNFELKRHEKCHCALTKYFNANYERIASWDGSWI